MSCYLNIENPNHFSQVVGFGFILCFDSFLHNFTILPIRFTLAIYRLIISIFSKSVKPFPPSQKADILRTLLLIISIIILIPLTDASRIYHSIRGQDTIKLYVIFNALEVNYDCMCRYITHSLLRSRIGCAHPLVKIYWIASSLARHSFH